LNGKWDYILVGGGLQNGLTALSVLERNPTAKLLVIERDGRLGGNHTWSFHLDSVPTRALDPDGRGWFAELVEHRWPTYSVRFPELDRTVPHAYATCSSERFAEVVGRRIRAAPNAEVWLDTEVTDIGATEVRYVRDGVASVLQASLVVDARGPRDGFGGRSGFQKFVGLEVELDLVDGKPPLNTDVAELMDATVIQDGGFRFIYVLPFSGTRALIEDTYFTNGDTLDRDTLRQRVLDYIAARGWRVREVVREEHGVLPMPWRQAGPIPRSAPLIAGYRGGWFHPATGYSVPVALRLACFIADQQPGAVFGPAFDALCAEQEQQSKFAYLLNELLFSAAEPELRWKVFRHFYALPDDLVLRFFSLEMTGSDKRKMFLRKPPPGVSFLKAMRILPGWGLR
jgi:lycopene beta-cyclase